MEMQHMRRRGFPPLVAFVAIVPAYAEDYPVKPIRAIVQAGAGSAIDVILRVVVDQLSAQLGQPSKIAPGPAAPLRPLPSQNRSRSLGVAPVPMSGFHKPNGPTRRPHRSARFAL